VVYNFSEGADWKVDTKSFQTLCMHVFKLDLSIVKSVRLGPKISNKYWPLLLTVEESDDKNYLISHSHFLCCHDQYKNIFIAPHRTKLERLKHKKAVDELRERCAKDESGLLIRNGVVIKLHLRPSASASRFLDAPSSDVPNSHSSGVPTNHSSNHSS